MQLIFESFKLGMGQLNLKPGSPQLLFSVSTVISKKIKCTDNAPVSQKIDMTVLEEIFKIIFTCKLNTFIKIGCIYGIDKKLQRGEKQAGQKMKREAYTEPVSLKRESPYKPEY